MPHLRPQPALFTRKTADTNQELAMPPVDPKRERMDDPDWNRFDSDDGRLFEIRPVQATLSTRRVASPIDIPQELVGALLTAIEGTMRSSSLSGAGWGDGEQRWMIDATPFFSRYAPWVADRNPGLQPYRVMAVREGGGNPALWPRVHGAFYSSRTRCIVIPVQNLMQEDGAAMPPPLQEDLWTTLHHELAHVFQEAWQGVEGYRGHPPLPEGHPIGDDIYEAKAYGSEACSDYDEDLRVNPELTIEEFLHETQWGDILQQFSGRERRRFLRDLAITRGRRTAGASLGVPQPSGGHPNRSGGAAANSVTSDGSPSGTVLAALFQRQARIPGTETTITIRVSPGTENSLVPLLEDLKTIGEWGCGRSVVVEDFTDEGSKEREKHGDGRHGFDGDGSDYIIDIKVEKGEPKPKKARLFTRGATKVGDSPTIGAGVHVSGSEQQRPRAEAHDLPAQALLTQPPPNSSRRAALFTRTANPRRDPGCGAFAQCVDAHPEMGGDAFFDYCTDHNRADCDSGELDNIGEAEIQRLFKEFTTKKPSARTALIQPARGEGVGAPAVNRRHLDEDFKEEVESERDPDLIRHTRGVEASAAWRPGK